MGERNDPKTLKDLRFSESPRETPAFREESASRPATQQTQVTSKQNLWGTEDFLCFGVERLAVPATCGSSWTRGRTRATAAATPDYP